MVGEQIFSSASNLRFLRLQVAWPEMISLCLWEDASIVLQLGFLAILFLCYIRNNLDYFCKGRKKLREVEKYPADGKYGLSYKLILVMHNGKIAQAGTFDELLKQNIRFEVLVGAHSQALDSVMTIESSSRASEFVAVETQMPTRIMNSLILSKIQSIIYPLLLTKN